MALRRPKVAPDRTGWHLLFPLGATELVTTPAADGKGKTTKVLWSEPALRGMVDARVAADEYAERFGMARQPWPVSMHHSIERRAWAGEQVGEANLGRVGNGWALHFHPGGATASGAEAPAGLYGLIEWTWAGLDHIRSGETIVISPTTMAKPATDGRPAGNTVVGAGLVDVAALDYIGTARDGFPLDTFGPDAAPVTAATEAADLRPMQLFADVMTRRTLTLNHDRPIMRSATYSEIPMDNTEAVENAEQAAEVAANDTLTLDAVMRACETDAVLRAGLAEKFGASMRAEGEAGTEPPNTVRLLESVLERLGAIEGTANKTLAGITELMAAEKADAEMELAEAAEMRRTMRQAANDLVMRHVRAGEIRGEANAKEAIRLTMEGSAIDHLLMRNSNPTAAAATNPKPSGVVGKTDDVPAATSVRMGDLQMRATQLAKQGDHVNPVKYGDELLRLHREAINSGLRIIHDGDKIGA